MASLDPETFGKDQADIWRFVQGRLQARDLLGARGVLQLVAQRGGDDVSLAQVLCEFISNYHGFLAQLSRDDISSLTNLLPNTPSFRALSGKMVAGMEFERDRLVGHLYSMRTEPKQRLAFTLHQVLYWLGLMDGLRVNYWVYHGIRLLEVGASVEHPLADFRSHVRAELLSALEMAPQSTAALKSNWTKSNYEGVDGFRKAVLATGIDEADTDAFIPCLDPLLRLRSFRTIR